MKVVDGDELIDKAYAICDAEVWYLDITEGSNAMEAVNKTNGNIYRIQQDTNGKWFGYCDRTKEYTPAFVKLKGLIGLFELKGYEVVEWWLI